MKIETVGLIGFGRFGTMAHRYLSAGKKVLVYDEDAARLKGQRDAAPLAEVAGCPLILLCVPISGIPAICRQLAPLLRADQIVVDTCSVKEQPLAWMSRLLPPRVQLLGTHPLFGPDSGRDGIAGLKIALVKGRLGEEAYRLIRTYLEGLQLVVIETTAQEHDRQIARSQAIFHLIAQAVKRLDWGAQAISTPGPETFQRLVRSVQHDTDQLFLDMEKENPHAGSARRRFIEELLELDRMLSRQGPTGPAGNP